MAMMLGRQKGGSVGGLYSGFIHGTQPTSTENKPGSLKPNMLARFQLGDSRPLRIGNGWKLPNNPFQSACFGVPGRNDYMSKITKIRSTWKGLNWMIPNHEYRKHIENSEK